MAYVIAEPCVGVKDGGCAQACPVDCIHTHDDAPQMYINPAECIHCGNCVSECPTEAIFADDQLPNQWKHYAQINTDYYR